MPTLKDRKIPDLNKDQLSEERIRQSIIPKLDQQLRFAEELIEQANRIAKEIQEKLPIQALPPSPTAKQAEQRAQEIRKGKQPEQGWYQHSTHAGTKGKEVEQPIQTVAEGKKPEQPQSHDSQTSLRRKKTRQHTTEPSIHKDPEAVKMRDYEMVKNVIERMTSVIYHRRKDVDFLGTDSDPEADNTISTACAAFRSIRQCADVKSTDAIEKHDRPFQEMEEAFCDFLRKLQAANRPRDENGDQPSEVRKGVEDALGLLIDEVELQEELIQGEAADLN